jgi:ankyrin repeat protein
VELYRKGDGETSEPLPFTYKPNVSAGMKRKRCDSRNLIPLPVSERDESTSRDYSLFVGSNSQSNTSQQFNENSSNTSHQHFEAEVDDEVDVEWSCIFNIIASSPKEFDIMVDEVFGGSQQSNVEHGKLETDSSEGCSREKIDLPLYKKIQLMLKLFKNDYQNDKMRDMLRTLIDVGNERDENILLDVIQHGAFADVKELVLILLKYKLLDVFNSKNNIDQNCLHLSILAGYTNLLKLFVTLGANVNQKDAFGITPLHEATRKNSLEMVKELLNSSDSMFIDEIEDSGRTSLSYAIYNDNVDIVKCLIGAGANLTKINTSNGFTCLHDAISVEAVNFGLVKYLVAANQDLLHIENYKGEKPIDLALTNKISDEIINYLSSFNEETDDIDEECLTELCAIFDKNDNWKMWLTLMDMEEKIEEWYHCISPTKALFEYLKVSLTSNRGMQERINFFLISQECEKNVR